MRDAFYWLGFDVNDLCCRLALVLVLHDVLHEWEGQHFLNAVVVGQELR